MKAEFYYTGFSSFYSDCDLNSALSGFNSGSWHFSINNNAVSLPLWLRVIQHDNGRQRGHAYPKIQYEDMSAFISSLQEMLELGSRFTSSKSRQVMMLAWFISFNLIYSGFWLVVLKKD